VLFAAMVAVMGAAAGAAGWAAGTFTTAAIVLGCAVLSAIVAVAMWGVMHWGERPGPTVAEPQAPRTQPAGYKTAA
jgi:hypothetical protein